MRLLYVCSDHGIAPGKAKGATVHVKAITEGLAACGHDVAILGSRDWSSAQLSDVECLTIPRLPGRDGVRNLKSWLIDRGYDHGAAQELRSLTYNAWMSEHGQELFGDRAFDAVVERLSLFGHVGVDLAAAWNVPLIVEVNAPLAEEAQRNRSLNNVSLAKAVEKQVLGKADAILAVSSQLANYLVASGIERRKIHVIPNGADTEIFEAAPSRKECRKSVGFREEFVIGFVGSLKRWHGVDILLTAFESFADRFPNVRLVVIGTGPEEETLRQETASSQFSRQIFLTGAVPHSEIPAYLRSFDVAVAPFRNTKNFYFSPIKLFEYMAAGLPIVASGIGQLEQVIEDGQDGLLFEAESPQSLTMRLEELYHSKPLRQRLADNACQKSKAYTWSRAAEETISVVKGCRKRLATNSRMAEKPSGPTDRQALAS